MLKPRAMTWRDDSGRCKRKRTWVNKSCVVNKSCLFLKKRKEMRKKDFIFFKKMEKREVIGFFLFLEIWPNVKGSRNRHTWCRPKKKWWELYLYIVHILVINPRYPGYPNTRVFLPHFSPRYPEVNTRVVWVVDYWPNLPVFSTFFTKNSEI